MKVFVNIYDYENIKDLIQGHKRVGMSDHTQLK